MQPWLAHTKFGKLNQETAIFNILLYRLFMISTSTTNLALLVMPITASNFIPNQYNFLQIWHYSYYIVSLTEIATNAVVKVFFAYATSSAFPSTSNGVGRFSRYSSKSWLSLSELSSTNAYPLLAPVRRSRITRIFFKGIDVRLANAAVILSSVVSPSSPRSISARLHGITKQTPHHLQQWLLLAGTVQSRGNCKETTKF